MVYIHLYIRLTQYAANLTWILLHPNSPVSMATDFNHIIWGENCEMEVRRISRLILSTLPNCFMHFMRICKCDGQLYSCHGILNTHTQFLYLSICDCTTVYRFSLSQYQVRASVTWQLRLLGSISSEMSRMCVCVWWRCGLQFLALSRQILPVLCRMLSYVLSIP